MNEDEQQWTERAIDLCSSAAVRGVTIVLIRRQDCNGGADIIVTNATSHKLVAALNGNYEVDEGENDE